MKMDFPRKTLGFLVVLLAILVVGFQTAAIGTTQLEEFIEVGAVNGKIFYTPVNDTKMSWSSARGLCSYFGLELAMFKSEEEFQFVRWNVPPNHSQLWIGASVRSQEQFLADGFEWLDKSNVTIRNFMFWPTANWVCVIFSQDDHLFTDLCQSGQYKPLCQSRPAK